MTALLLDTHAFIWLTENDPNLPEVLRARIDTADRVYLSIVSFWEIAIKVNLGKLVLQRNYEEIGPIVEASDILVLPISFADTVQIKNLRLHHRDPFDRLLIAQAITHSLAIVTKDQKFSAYPVQCIWSNRWEP